MIGGPQLSEISRYQSETISRNRVARLMPDKSIRACRSDNNASRRVIDPSGYAIISRLLEFVGS